MFEGLNPQSSDNGARYTSVEVDGNRIKVVPWPILETLSISRYCPASAFEELASDPPPLSAQKINSLKKSLEAVFKGAAHDLESCGPERRKDFFTVLTKELFDNFEQFKQLQGFYFELCVQHLKIDIKNFQFDPELVKAAEKAALQSGYTREWHESDLHLCLSPEFRFSAQWCDKRITYLEDRLATHEEIVNLPRVIHTDQFEGVNDYLISNLASFSDLRFSYTENLLSCFAKEDFYFDPESIFHSLVYLGEPLFLENSKFMEARDECLKDKFTSGYIADIPEFMAFYERNSLHTLDFLPKDRDLFGDMLYYAANSLIESVSLGDTALHRSQRVIAQVFLQDELHYADSKISKDLRRAVAHGTKSILNNNDQRLEVNLTPLDLFISLLPDKYVFGVAWGKEFGHLAENRIRQVVTCFNVLCEEFKNVTNADIERCPGKYTQKIHKIHAEYLPFIERIPFYREIFGIRGSLLRIPPLPPSLADALSAEFNYSPGKFIIPSHPQPHFSLLSWYKNRITFQRRINSKEIAEANHIAHGLVELAINNLSPESLCHLVSKLPGASPEYRLHLKEYADKVKSAQSITF